MMIRHFHVSCLLVIIVNSHNGLLITANAYMVDDDINDNTDNNNDHASEDTLADTNESRIAADAGQSKVSSQNSRHVRDTEDQENT